MHPPDECPTPCSPGKRNRPVQHDASMRRPNFLRHILAAVGRAPRQAARALITIYTYTFSALVGFHCRHLPTCSKFADEAIGRFGLWAGGWMTLARLCRCHPFGTSGLDLVPAALPADASWYLPWRYGLWRTTNAGDVDATDRTP